MFVRYFLIFGVVFLFQETQGWFDKQTFLSPLVSPVTEATKKLQTTLDEIAAKKQDLEVQKKQLKQKIENIPKECQTEDLSGRFAMFDKWNFDSCVNLTDDMKAGSELVAQGYVYARNITGEVGTLGGKILDCPNLDFSNILSCYNQNLKALRAQIVSFKNETVPIVHNSVIVSRALRHDLDHCIGIPETLRDRVEKEIESIKC